MKELLNKIYDKLANNHFNGIDTFDFGDFDYGFVDEKRMEIVLISDDAEYVLTLTKRPYED